MKIKATLWFVIRAGVTLQKRGNNGKKENEHYIN